MTLARAKNIWGPYEVHPDNPLLTSYPYPRNPLQKAGHASMVQTHTGRGPRPPHRPAPAQGG